MGRLLCWVHARIPEEVGTRILINTVLTMTTIDSFHPCQESMLLSSWLRFYATILLHDPYKSVVDVCARRFHCGLIPSSWRPMAGWGPTYPAWICFESDMTVIVNVAILPTSEIWAGYSQQGQHGRWPINNKLVEQLTAWPILQLPATRMNRLTASSSWSYSPLYPPSPPSATFLSSPPSSWRIIWKREVSIHLLPFALFMEISKLLCIFDQMLRLIISS